MSDNGTVFQERARLGGYREFGVPHDLRGLAAALWSYSRPVGAPPIAGEGHRLLPDTDPQEFLRTLQRIVGDTAVHFTGLLQPKPPLENPIDTDLFRAIERASRERDPSALVTTPMLTAATDRPTYRRLGIITYGFDPFKVEASDIQTGMHGNNERLSVANVGFRASCASSPLPPGRWPSWRPRCGP